MFTTVRQVPHTSRGHDGAPPASLGVAQANALLAYASLRELGVVPLVFTHDANVRAWLDSIGIRHDSSHASNEFGMPFLGDMWRIAERYRHEIGAPFVGFANADMLFGPGLPYTLQHVAAGLEHGSLRRPVLAIGMRRAAKVHRLPAMVDEVRDLCLPPTPVDTNHCPVGWRVMNRCRSRRLLPMGTLQWGTQWTSWPPRHRLAALPRKTGWLRPRTVWTGPCPR